MTGTILIPSITGAQQAAIAEGFRTAGWRVRGTSRRTGADHVADLESGAGLAEAMAGCEAVAMTLVQDHRDGAMPRIVERVAGAAREAGVRRLVLNTAGSIDEGSDDALFRDMRAARDAALGAGIEAVVVVPTVFLENLAQDWSRQAIAAGTLVYPAPAEAPVSWISHCDLAAFTVWAMEHAKAGAQVRVGGPEPLTGVQLADRIGGALGRDLQYVQLPLDDFAAAMSAALGAEAGPRLRQHYAAADRDPEFLRVDPARLPLAADTLESAEAFARRVLAE
ncbi:SDR family oxidoreductase [Pontivivens ytuae]|uniref:NAD(P)H-binding protein n=1 Tax=Pontivivens ytuae TaxID=2789856 RepID=A0A7S9LRV7_9RHOB|nr:NAD(P)H-binding protein [Pontivivens ytuae]QPH53595.1 NAD(P)H-binding protein [Pontivivens ytuae]